jgi:hypothetical protein
MVCPNCGYNNQTGNRFCVRCGIDVAAPPVPETPSFDSDLSPGAAPPPPPPPPYAPPAAAPAGTPPAANPWGAPQSSPGQWAPPGQAPPAPYLPTPPAAAPNPFAPPAPPSPYGQPGAYPPPPYAPSGYPVPPSTNGLAIAALILGLVGWMPCGLGSIIAVVFGFVARGQIKESRGRQSGDGMALAGIILGFLGIALVVLWVVLIAVSSPDNT